MTILGLPLHPLVVHAVVVLLPLGALGLIALFFLPRGRQAYLLLSVLVTAAGTLSAFVAKLAGESLAQERGAPAPHELYGNLTVIAATLLLIAAAVWWLADRRARASAGGPAPSAGAAPTGTNGQVATLSQVGTISAIATVVLSLVVLVLVVLTGHSGATAVWG